MKRGLTVISPLVVVGCVSAAVALSPAPSGAQASPPPAATAAPAPPITVQATANVVDATGAKLGTLSFSDTPAGLLVSGTLTGLAAGPHGIHLHTVGLCEAPFTTAGGHFNPSGAKHGYRNPMGHHAGDMPNIVAPAAGAFSFEFMVDGVKLTGAGGLLDADGTAVVIHAGADDHMTDPAGASGARVACGVITAAK
jgi:Cu-Zn family superoxide dismutase